MDSLGVTNVFLNSNKLSTAVIQCKPRIAEVSLVPACNLPYVMIMSTSVQQTAQPYENYKQEMC